MKLFLAHNSKFSGMKVEKSTFFPFVIKITPEGICPHYSNDKSLTKAEKWEPCDALRQLLQTAEPSAGLLTCEWTALSSTFLSFRVLSSPLTNFLVQLFGEGVAMQATLSTFFGREATTENYLWSTENMESSEMKIKVGQGIAFEDMDIRTGSDDFNAFLWTNKKNELNITGDLTLVVTVDTPVEPVVTDKLQVVKKMLSEELGSDLVIIAGNGKQVKAHKCMLLTQSQVFNAMFQSDMMEAQRSTVEMRDMSEEGVRALLAYLYCWETKEPNSKPMVALELLQAGHKYNIPVLETAMKKLLLGKPNKWYEADVSLNLFYFAKKLPEEEGTCLKMKALRVMKGNFADFKESTTFITLFKQDPETAMELSAHFAA